MTLKIVYLDGSERIIEDVIYWSIPAFTIPGTLLIQVRIPTHGPFDREYELYIVDQNDISFFEDLTGKEISKDDHQETELHPDNR